MKGPLGDRLTVSRAGPATYFLASGLIKNAGPTEPRLNCNPMTGARLGLLIEPSAVNNLTQSQLANGLADVPTRGGAVTALNGAFPQTFGGTTAVRLAGNGALAFAYKSAAVITGALTMSVFVEMEDDLSPAGAFSILCRQAVIPPARTVYDRLRGREWRVSGNALSGEGVTGNYGVIQQAVQATRAFRVTGYQMETGSVASSYIPTTTEAVTRSADVATFALPSGSHNLIYTFDDGSTVTATGQSGTVTIPTGFTRRNIRTIIARPA